MSQSLYESDFYTWTQQQSQALATQNLKQLDWQNLAEELADLGNRHYDQLSTRLSILIAHLLKWQYQPDHRSNSWRATIREQRRRLERLLARNPGLKHRWAEALMEAWLDGRDLAIQETGLGDDVFPEDCPFSSAQLQDFNYWPNGSG